MLRFGERGAVVGLRLAVTRVAVAFVLAATNLSLTDNW